MGPWNKQPQFSGAKSAMALHSHSLKVQVQPIHRLSRHPWGRPLCPVPGSCQKRLESPCQLLAGADPGPLSLQVRGWRAEGATGAFSLSTAEQGGPPGTYPSAPRVPQDAHPPNLPLLQPTSPTHHGPPFLDSGPDPQSPRASGLGRALPGSSQARSPHPPKFSRVSDLPTPLRRHPVPVPVPGVPVPKELTASSAAPQAGAPRSQAPAQSSGRTAHMAAAVTARPAH